MIHHALFHIDESSSIGDLRRHVQKMASQFGFTEEQCGRLAIISNEMSTNLIKHATRCRKILVRPISRQEMLGVEIISLDQGPGMKNVYAALKDGYTTSGSIGAGLGAIKRLSDEFDMYSLQDKGTVVLSRVYFRNITCVSQAERINAGYVSIPKTGQQVCGDALFIQAVQPVIVFLADGLGHGPGASEASKKAVQLISQIIHMDVDHIIRYLHEHLHDVRGIVGAIAKFHSDEIEFAGVGNISAQIVSPEHVRRCMSYDGIIGVQRNENKKHFYEFHENSLFIMHSDGLSMKTGLAQYPGIDKHDPSIIAAILYRDFHRDYDDATVVVVKKQKRSSLSCIY